MYSHEILRLHVLYLVVLNKRRHSCDFIDYVAYKAAMGKEIDVFHLDVGQDSKTHNFAVMVEHTCMYKVGLHPIP